MTIKNSTATTMIADSTAAGEPIPPHFQFQTHAQSVDTQSVNINLVTFLPNIKGKFGLEKAKEWPVTWVMSSSENILKQILLLCILMPKMNMVKG